MQIIKTQRAVLRRRYISRKNTKSSSEVTIHQQEKHKEQLRDHDTSAGKTQRAAPRSRYTSRKNTKEENKGEGEEQNEEEAAVEAHKENTQSVQ